MSNAAAAPIFNPSHWAAASWLFSALLAGPVSIQRWTLYHRQSGSAALKNSQLTCGGKHYMRDGALGLDQQKSEAE